MQPIIRFSICASLLLAVGVASGCTVRPMLADSTVSAPSGQLSQLRSIEVAAVDTRQAQEVRNHLIFLLYGGAEQAPNPEYRLDLNVTQRITSAVKIQTGTTHESTAGTVSVSAIYKLVNVATGDALAQTRLETTASFDRSLQEYAVVRAERDAENRAARELAELIRLSVAQDLLRISNP